MPAFLLLTLLAACSVFPVQALLSAAEGSVVSDNVPMRGIWLTYREYEALGLTILESETSFRNNADTLLEEAQKYGINTVFLHARAFDDAFWRSPNFRASKYVSADESLTAAEAYAEYDPFGVFLEEAHKYGIEVHAWLNPYRVSLDYYYDPADDASIERMLLAVRELLAYESAGEKIDGIHIDDYFYHARNGYFRPGNPSDKYAIVGSEGARPKSGKYHVVTSAEKRTNVNKMVKKVYSVVTDAGSTFGISPTGNYDNDMRDGADIDTWLSQDGYIDYIIPQIYWTNQWGNDGHTRMFTNRLDQFLAKRKNDARFYVGLALYRAAETQGKSDPGWRWKKTNLAEQIAELEKKGADGYVLFSSQYLFKSAAAQELSNIRR